MHFDSTSFMLLFASCLIVERSIRWSTIWRARVLLVLSYGFYATWSPLYVPFLLASTALDHWAARWMDRATSPGLRRVLLALSLAVNFSLLGFFKYASFVAEIWAPTTPDTQLLVPPLDGPFVPLGISFFTFQTVSYTIDVYRRQLSPARSIGEFALFVSFFPQLVAGPIVRAGELLPQLRSVTRATRAQLGWGLALIVLGLFQKVVIADAILRPIAGGLFESTPGSGTAADHWLGVYAFMLQLYHDFSGYSNMAIGMAACLGYELPENFRWPFAATSLAEFWTRWHISLTRWFGSYVYRPLGGRRVGPIHAGANVCVVMLLAGLWHGASWTFVLWGGVHAIGLISGRGIQWLAARKNCATHESCTRVSVPPIIPSVFIFILVGQSCLLFRAHDLGHAVDLARVFYGWDPATGPSLFGAGEYLAVLVCVLGCLGLSRAMHDIDLRTWFLQRRAVSSIVVLTAMLGAVVVLMGQPHSYIYFQF